VDSGGFAARYGVADTLKSQYLLHGLSLLHYQVLNLGDDDLCLGSKFLARMHKKYRLAFISANVYDAKTKRLFAPAYVIKRVGGMKILGIDFGGRKIGILGVTNDECFPECRIRGRFPFTVSDPIQAARSVVEKLRHSCDLVIALAHLGTDQCSRLAQEVPGIDLIVCGHATSPEKDPRIAGKTMIVQSGAQGRYIGEMEIELGPHQGISSYRTNLIVLDKNIANDPEMNRIVEKYKNVQWSPSNAANAAPQTFNGKGE
jgi:5'-nucleotidase/UDP-sugar diphosphatase